MEAHTAQQVELNTVVGVAMIVGARTKGTAPGLFTWSPSVVLASPNPA